MIKYQYISYIIKFFPFLELITAEILLIFGLYDMPIRRKSFKMVH